MLGYSPLMPVAIELEKSLFALPPEERYALGTHALAAGPALAGEDGQTGHVGQDDIDALFD